MNSHVVQLDQRMVYFANNEQASIPVFNAVFCLTHAEYNLIKYKLYNKWSSQTVNSVYVKFKETNQICWPLKISQSINTAWSTCDRNNYGMLLLWKQEIPWLFDAEHRKKVKMVKMYFLKLLLKIFFVSIKKLFMADLSTHGHHKKVLICYISMLYN